MASTRSSAGKLKVGLLTSIRMRSMTSLKRTVRISLQSTYSKIEIYPLFRWSLAQCISSVHQYSFPPPRPYNESVFNKLLGGYLKWKD